MKELLTVLHHIMHYVIIGVWENLDVVMMSYISFLQSQDSHSVQDPGAILGAEYSLHVPNEFQDICLYVYDYDLMG